MGWSPFKKSSWKKVGKKIEKTAEKATDFVEDTGSKAINEIEDLAKQAEKLGMSVVDDIKNLANKAKREIEGAANKAKSEIRDEIGKAKDFAERAEKVAGQIENQLESLPGKADELITEKLPALVTDELPKALEGLMQEIAANGLKPALKGAAAAAKSMHRGLRRVRESHPDFVAEIDKLGTTVTVKANVEIKLVYSEFYKRGEEVAGILDRYGNDGLKPRRRDIRGFLVATGATTIDFGGGASLSLGVDLGVKVLLNKISGRLFVLLVDTILDEMGVPE